MQELHADMAQKAPDEWTSMTIKKRTYDRVKAQKRGGETFDEVLTRLSERTPSDANP